MANNRASQSREALGRTPHGDLMHDRRPSPGRLFSFSAGTAMTTTTDKEQLAALDAELAEKLPEGDLCRLTTMYSLCYQFAQPALIEDLEHLYDEHDDVAATETIVAMLRFVDTVGRFEAALFAQYDIHAERRLDVGANAITLRELTAALEDVQLIAATKESENHVRH